MDRCEKLTLDMKGRGVKGVLTVETIGKVRLALEKGESQRSIARKYRMSRKTVKKIESSGETEFKYTRRKEIQYPVLGSFIERLGEILQHEAELPSKSRCTGKKIYEILQREGYSGGYDAVRRYIRTWKEEHRSKKSAYIPLVFARGEAFQFDWSEEIVEIGGVERKLQVAQFRLCHMRFLVGYFGVNANNTVNPLCSRPHGGVHNRSPHCGHCVRGVRK